MDMIPPVLRAGFGDDGAPPPHDDEETKETAIALLRHFARVATTHAGRYAREAQDGRDGE